MTIEEEVEDRKREVEELAQFKGRVEQLTRIANDLLADLTAAHIGAMGRHNEAQGRLRDELQRKRDSLRG